MVVIGKWFDTFKAGSSISTASTMYIWGFQGHQHAYKPEDDNKLHKLSPHLKNACRKSDY